MAIKERAKRALSYLKRFGKKKNSSSGKRPLNSSEKRKLNRNFDEKLEKMKNENFHKTLKKNMQDENKMEIMLARKNAIKRNEILQVPDNLEDYYEIEYSTPNKKPKSKLKERPAQGPKAQPLVNKVKALFKKKTPSANTSEKIRKGIKQQVEPKLQKINQKMLNQNMRHLGLFDAPIMKNKQNKKQRKDPLFSASPLKFRLPPAPKQATPPPQSLRRYNPLDPLADTPPTTSSATRKRKLAAAAKEAKRKTQKMQFQKSSQKKKNKLDFPKMLKRPVYNKDLVFSLSKTPSSSSFNVPQKKRVAEYVDDFMNPMIELQDAKKLAKSIEKTPTIKKWINLINTRDLVEDEIEEIESKYAAKHPDLYQYLMNLMAYQEQQRERVNRVANLEFDDKKYDPILPKKPPQKQYVQNENGVPAPTLLNNFAPTNYLKSVKNWILPKRSLSSTEKRMRTKFLEQEKQQQQKKEEEEKKQQRRRNAQGQQQQKIWDDYQKTFGNKKKPKPEIYLDEKNNIDEATMFKNMYGYYFNKKNPDYKDIKKFNNIGYFRDDKDDYFLDENGNKVDNDYKGQKKLLYKVNTKPDIWNGELKNPSAHENEDKDDEWMTAAQVKEDPFYNLQVVNQLPLALDLQRNKKLTNAFKKTAKNAKPPSPFRMPTRAPGLKQSTFRKKNSSSLKSSSSKKKTSKNKKTSYFSVFSRKK